MDIWKTIKKEGRWLVHANDKKQKVAFCLDHVANIYVECHDFDRPRFGSFSLVFVMVNGREVHVPLKLVMTMDAANAKLEDILKEIQ